MTDSVLLTVTECATALSVSRARAYELVAAGTIPVLRIGRSTRVPRRALEEWVTKMLIEQAADSTFGVVK